MTAIAALAGGLIDYAGLFPPAALEMSAAVRQYAAHRRGPHAWALGRFIVPLARLGEMRQAAAALGEAGDWKLSVLALPGEALPPEIDSVEMKVERAEDIRRVSEDLPALRYFEIPIATDPRELVAVLADTGGRAKIRTGGLTPESCPGVAELARFLCACAPASVPFKATAGLHHPLAAAKGAPPSHGFVNLFLAAALAYHGVAREELAATPGLPGTASGGAVDLPAFGRPGQAHPLPHRPAPIGSSPSTAAGHRPVDTLLRSCRGTEPGPEGIGPEGAPAAGPEGIGPRERTCGFPGRRAGPPDVAATLEETSADAFRWDADGVSWRGHRLSAGQIAAARAQFAIAFGSCSFEEPIGGLQALGWL
jgi:hypothetical protein